MKAKEYAQNIIDNNFSNESISQTITRLVREISTICEQRKCRTPEAISSVFKEVDDKYKAMCRIVNKNRPMLIESGFRGVVEDAFKDNKDVMSLGYFKKVDRL